MTFQQAMKQARKRRGWTQDIVALELKSHQCEICQIENGKRTPRLDIVEAIAKVLDLKMTAPGVWQ